MCYSREEKGLSSWSIGQKMDASKTELPVTSLSYRYERRLSSEERESDRCTFSLLGTFKTTLICQSNNYRSRMVTTIPKQTKNPHSPKPTRNRAPNNLSVASMDVKDSVKVY